MKKEYSQITLTKSLIGKNVKIEVPSMGITYNHDDVYNIIKDRLKTNNTWNNKGYWAYPAGNIPPNLRIYFEFDNADIKAAHDYALRHGFVYHHTNNRNTHYFDMKDARVAYTPVRKFWSLHFDLSFDHPRLRKTSGYKRIKDEIFQFEFNELHLAVEAINRIYSKSPSFEDLKKDIKTIQFTDMQKIELVKLVFS